MKLSILIPTLPSRYDFYKGLQAKLFAQIGDRLNREVEVLSDVRAVITTGEKRNDLLKLAQGKYTVFVDDDDDIADSYINDILEAIEQEPDCVTFDGWMTTDGKLSSTVHWHIRLGEAYEERGGRYYRFPNILAPMKREIACSVKFRKVTLGEDYPWAKEIHDRGLLKTEVYIPKELYHYKFRSKK